MSLSACFPLVPSRRLVHGSSLVGWIVRLSCQSPAIIGLAHLLIAVFKYSFVLLSLCAFCHQCFVPVLPSSAMSNNQHSRRIGLLIASLLASPYSALGATISASTTGGVSQDVIDSSSNLQARDCPHGTYLVRLFVQSGQIGDADCQASTVKSGTSLMPFVQAAIGDKSAITMEQKGGQPIWMQKVELGCVNPEAPFQVALVNGLEGKICFLATIDNWTKLESLTEVSGFKKLTLAANGGTREVPFRASSDTGLSWMDLRLYLTASEQAAAASNPMGNVAAGFIILFLLVFVIAFFAAFAYQYRHSIKAWYQHHIQGIKEEDLHHHHDHVAPEKKGENQEIA